MTEFDPSPRSSKRRRTGTYAIKRTTLSATETNSAQDDDHEEVPRNKSIPGSPRTIAHQEPSTTSNDLEPTPVSKKEAGNADQDARGTRRSSARRPSHRHGKDAPEVVAADQSAKEVDENGEGKRDETSIDKGQETEKSSQAVDPTNTPTRSSGRTRRVPKRFAEKEEPSSVDSSTMKRRKQAATDSRKPSPGLPQQALQSPQPKGILTPSRRGRRTGPRKSVVFDGNQGDKQIEEQLGFKDINSSTMKKGRRTAAKGSEAERAQSVGLAETEKEEAEKATSPIDADTDDDILVDSTPNVEEILLQPAAHAGTLSGEAPETTMEDDPHVTKIKSEILHRLTKTSLSPIAHLEKEYTTLHTLLSATITAGESNSLLLLGSRGSGKTLLVEHALDDLTRKHAEDFHVVRLSGFFQTDDKLALREIWRQLGREMAVSEDETGEVSSYADTMTSLLGLLSHPDDFDHTDADAMQVDGVPPSQDADRKTSKSVVFVLDEFDLFTFHPRQTLLYNLFDIAQAKKAPIAVVGCSTRMDVVDLLEKRVKSRFSHRWLHVAAMKSLAAFEEAVRGILSLPADGSEALGLSISDLEWRGKWNGFIKVRLGELDHPGEHQPRTAERTKNAHTDTHTFRTISSPRRRYSRSLRRFSIPLNPSLTSSQRCTSPSPHSPLVMMVTMKLRSEQTANLSHH